MTDINRVSGPSRNRIETGRANAATAARRSRASADTRVSVDAGPGEPTDLPQQSLPPLPPAGGPVDYGLAGSATQVIADNVAVDFGHIAALMMQIDSELARAARDSQVEEIESVASQMHASAADIRESATYALVGGVVSGGVQIASAGISVGGGIKGMSLTRAMPAAEPQVVEPETMSGEETPSAPKVAGESEASTPASGEAGAGALEDVDLPDSGRAEASEARTAQVREETTQETVKEVSTAKRKAAIKLDHTLSQQLSARAQNIALITDGMSKLAGATGEIMKSAMDYESRQKEADSKERDARAEELRAYLDRAKGFADSMQKGAQDMLQVFQQMEDSSHETHKKIWTQA
ncbi:MAG: hypothetical protein OXE40_05740 [Gammaproteobacteria bacterium]|nr:hypothetical protein [Gammaproteobacteria bacterium]